MSDSRNSSNDLRKSIHDFVVAGANNELTEDQWTNFEQLLRESDEACRMYAGYVGISVFLPSILASMPDNTSSLSGTYKSDQETSALFPSVFLGGVLQNPLGYLSSGWPMAYLVATAMLAIGLWGLSNTYISPSAQVADSMPFSGNRHTAGSNDEKTLIVGRISGMIDCKWLVRSEDSLSSPAYERAAGHEGGLSKSNALHSPVFLGDRFDIRSGLLEITYDTGAKIILQGPVEYEVESSAGGYLAIGKLTAQLEKENQKLPSPACERRGERGLNQSDGLHSAAPLFAVRTPTATVTDLGTEFGVEVDKQGTTTSHVFRGSVNVQYSSANGKSAGDSRVLHKGETAVVKGSGTDRRIMGVRNFTSSRFVRNIPGQSNPTIKTFDLVDVVAGGNGFSGQRGRGIDPTNGRSIDTPFKTRKDASANVIYNIIGDEKYHRVEATPLVDGVFIPSGRSGAVQVDSANHTFAEFGPTDGMTGMTIWAGWDDSRAHFLDAFLGRFLASFHVAHPQHLCQPNWAASTMPYQVMD